MGVSLVVGLLSVAVGAVSTAAQIKQGNKAAAAEKEARDIQNAHQKNTDTNNRRKDIREARVRRAQILQSAENTGVGASSGQFGATGAINTNLGSANSFRTAGQFAADGVSTQLNNAAQARLKGSQTAAIGNLFTSAFQTIFS